MRTSIKSQTDTDAGRAARAAYMRQWRAANRDRVRQYNQSYWKRKAEALEAMKTGEDGMRACENGC